MQEIWNVNQEVTDSAAPLLADFPALDRELSERDRDVPQCELLEAICRVPAGAFVLEELLQAGSDLDWLLGLQRVHDVPPLWLSAADEGGLPEPAWDDNLGGSGFCDQRNSVR
jgi:hypothetical protein